MVCLCECGVYGVCIVLCGVNMMVCVSVGNVFCVRTVWECNVHIVYVVQVVYVCCVWVYCVFCMVNVMCAV